MDKNNRNLVRQGIGLLIAILVFGSFSVSAQIPDVFNLADFEAAGDGLTDDGPALQQALNAVAAAGGGTLIVPAGLYLIKTLTTVSDLISARWDSARRSPGPISRASRREPRTHRVVKL